MSPSNSVKSNKSLKVLYISYDGILEPIGKSQVISYLINLSKEDIKFTIISFEKPHNLQDTTNVKTTTDHLLKNNINWIPLKYHKRFRFFATGWDILTGVIVGVFIYKNFKFKVVHSRSFIASVIAFILKLFVKPFFIYDVRGFWSDERLMANRLKKGFFYLLINYMERKLLEKADHVIVLTEAAKTHLKSFSIINLNKVSYIPCCVDERFRFSEEARSKIRAELGLADRFIVLHTGSLEKWYRIDKMLECFLTIKEVIKNAHFLILSSMDKHDLDSYMVKLGLSWDAVTIAKVRHDVMPHYISASDVGLFFLKTPPAAAGFSPVKLAEYISCHLPVISNTKIGDMDTLFSSYKVGSLISEYAPEAYSRATNEIILIKKEQEQFKKECDRAVCKELSIKVGSERYSDIYKTFV